MRSSCTKCEKTHPPNRCPAWGKVCFGCGKPNHFASFWTSSRRINSVDFEHETIEQIKENESLNKKVGESIVFPLNCGNSDKVVAQLKIIDEEQSLSSNINFKLDTGSQINAIPKYIFDKEFRKAELKPIYILLTAFRGSNLRPIGKCNLTCVYKNVLHVLEFFIVNCRSPLILGLKGCQEMGLVTLSCEKRNY